MFQKPPVGGCSANTSSSSSMPMPGAVGSGAYPFSTGRQPRSASNTYGSRRLSNVSRILKFGIDAAACTVAVVQNGELELCGATTIECISAIAAILRISVRSEEHTSEL